MLKEFLKKSALNLFFMASPAPVNRDKSEARSSPGNEPALAPALSPWRGRIIVRWFERANLPNNRGEGERKNVEAAQSTLQHFIFCDT
jgi:hypothetical protein